MYYNVVKVMYCLNLWETQGDQFAEGTWWPYVGPILEKLPEPLRREMAVAYILALFTIYQDFICMTFPEYVSRNEDWNEILEEIEYKADERILIYLAGKYNVPYPTNESTPLALLLALAEEFRKPIATYLGQLYVTPEKAFEELTIHFPIYTRYDIEEGYFPYSKAGFDAFCQRNMIFPNTTTNQQ